MPVTVVAAQYLVVRLMWHAGGTSRLPLDGRSACVLSEQVNLRS
jgi:hypothetical protein